MGVIKETLKKQIDASNKTQFNDSTAIITDYDVLNNTASIRYRNPNGEGVFHRSNVAITNNLGGLTGSGIYIGARCSITFLNNNVFAPMITGLIDSNFLSKTSTDQGSFLVDGHILKTQEPKEIIPMYSDWLDYENENKLKYNNDFANFTDKDISADTYYMINMLDKYKTTEQGITNLDTKANVKLKEDGDIDIFIDNNIGIRICKSGKSINVYGDLNLFGKLFINGIPIEKFVNDGRYIPDIDDIILLINIESLLKDIDDDIKELKRYIKITSIIAGNGNQFTPLEIKINEYLLIKQDYMNRKYGFKELQKLYGTLSKYSSAFKEGLKTASDVKVE